MSVEELRVQKALALLEFKEAGKRAEQLERQAKKVGDQIKEFGSLLAVNPTCILEDDPAKFIHLNVTSVYDLVRRLKDAQAQLAEATHKKDLFGLD